MAPDKHLSECSCSKTHVDDHRRPKCSILCIILGFIPTSMSHYVLPLNFHFNY